jgi:hypothetical protein
VSALAKTRTGIIAHNGFVQLGPRVTVSFHRTLRVPEDGGSYPLPPSFGRLQLYACADYKGSFPESWNQSGSFFIPLYQREALWLGFDGESWHPTALVIGADGVNVITGQPWDAPLAGVPQNYVVVPDQPWLDGIRTRVGLVRQFVAMPLGGGFTLTEQVGRRSAHNGIQLRVHEAKPGRFPDEAPMCSDLGAPLMMRSPSYAMGIGAGGTITQKIYPDTYGFGTWERDGTSSAQIYLINSEQFSSITGEGPPPSTISAADYTKSGFPWFELWDAERGDLGSQSVLEDVKSIGTVAASKGLSRQEPAIHVPKNQIKKVRRSKAPRSRTRQ